MISKNVLVLERNTRLFPFQCNILSHKRYPMITFYESLPCKSECTEEVSKSAFFFLIIIFFEIDVHLCQIDITIKMCCTNHIHKWRENVELVICACPSMSTVSCSNSMTTIDSQVPFQFGKK